MVPCEVDRLVRSAEELAWGGHEQEASLGEVALHTQVVRMAEDIHRNGVDQVA